MKAAEALKKAKSKLKSKDEKPSASDRAALVAALRILGIPDGKLAQVIVNGKSRKELRDDLIAYLRDLPKG